MEQNTHSQTHTWLYIYIYGSQDIKLKKIDITNMKNYKWLQIWSKVTVLYSFNLVDLDVLAYNSKTVIAKNFKLASFEI